MPYSGNPGSSDEDHVRFLLGDTTVSCPELTDEEVTFLLMQNGNNPLLAAIFGAQALCAKFTGLVDSSAGRQRQAFSQKANAYKRLQTQLSANNAMFALPISTGQTVNADRIDSQDRNLKQPNFQIADMDNPRAGSPAEITEDRGGQP